MQVNIPSTVDLPESIQIKLVREDFFDVSNIFRVFFEVAIAFLGAMFGALVTMEKFELIHWLLFAILLISSIVFLVLWLHYYKKSKEHQFSPKREMSEFPFRFAGFLANINLEHVQKVKSLLNDMGISEEQLEWHNNKIKTKHKTLRIKKLPIERLTEILNQIKQNKIDYIDFKWEL
jgi:hypothetical protein